MKNISPRSLIWFLRSMPNFLWPLKWLIIKNSLNRVGKNFRFGPNSIFSDHRLIEIGNNVFFSDGTIINTQVPVYIGDNVMFGPEVMLIGGDHNFKVAGKLMNQVKEGGVNMPIILENDVWIGARCTILKGVKIGEGAVIGAGSLVTKSLPPYSICVGNPCKPLKCRFSIDELNKHLLVIKSSHSFEDILQSYRQWNINI